MKLAQGDTGGSRVAAQVLLSAYNGEAWQLNVVDLCVLDKSNYKAALDVIRGRVELYIEPHTLIANGIRFSRNCGTGGSITTWKTVPSLYARLAPEQGEDGLTIRLRLNARAARAKGTDESR